MPLTQTAMDSSDVLALLGPLIAILMAVRILCEAYMA